MSAIRTTRGLSQFSRRENGPFPLPNPIRVGAIWAALAALALPGVGRVTIGQEEVPTPPAVGAPLPEARLPQLPNTYGPREASRDAYQRGEQHRRSAIDRQLQVQADLAWYYGQPGYWPYPSGLEAAYAGPRWRAPIVRGAVRAYRYYLGSYPIFEPWPFVPGDIYGYPYFYRVPQPLGHRVIPTGPNGYVYRPVYPSDVRPPQGPTPAPRLPETFGAAQEPAQEPVPAPPPEPGPREF